MGVVVYSVRSHVLFNFVGLLRGGTKCAYADLHLWHTPSATTATAVAALGLPLNGWYVSWCLGCSVMGWCGCVGKGTCCL